MLVQALIIYALRLRLAENGFLKNFNKLLCCKFSMLHVALSAVSQIVLNVINETVVETDLHTVIVHSSNHGSRCRQVVCDISVIVD